MKNWFPVDPILAMSMQYERYLLAIAVDRWPLIRRQIRKLATRQCDAS